MWARQRPRFLAIVSPALKSSLGPPKDRPWARHSNLEPLQDPFWCLSIHSGGLFLLGFLLIEVFPPPHSQRFFVIRQNTQGASPCCHSSTPQGRPRRESAWQPSMEDLLSFGLAENVIFATTGICTWGLFHHGGFNSPNDRSLFAAVAYPAGGKCFFSGRLALLSGIYLEFEEASLSEAARLVFRGAFLGYLLKKMQHLEV